MVSLIGKAPMVGSNFSYSLQERTGRSLAHWLTPESGARTYDWAENSGSNVEKPLYPNKSVCIVRGFNSSDNESCAQTVNDTAEDNLHTAGAAFTMIAVYRQASLIGYGWLALAEIVKNAEKYWKWPRKVDKWTENWRPKVGNCSPRATNSGRASHHQQKNTLGNGWKCWETSNATSKQKRQNRNNSNRQRYDTIMLIWETIDPWEHSKHSIGDADWCLAEYAAIACVITWCIHASKRTPINVVHRQWSSQWGALYMCGVHHQTDSGWIVAKVTYNRNENACAKFLRTHTHTIISWMKKSSHSASRHTNTRLDNESVY